MLEDKCKLVRTMLCGKLDAELIANIEHSLVEDMEDGGIKRIRLVTVRADLAHLAMASRKPNTPTRTECL